MEENHRSNTELHDINEYVEFLKDQMEILSAAFEEFDLDTYLECVRSIHFQSSVFKQEGLRDFCAGYMKLIETYEFEGIYAKIQELVELATETINTLEDNL